MNKLSCLKIKVFLLQAGVVLFLCCFSYFLGPRWLFGFGIVAIALGSLVTWFIRKVLRRYVEWYGVPRNELGIDEETEIKHRLQPFLVGVFERTFFTVLLALNVQGVAAGLMLWVAAKMLSGWNRAQVDNFANRVRSFNALMMNLTSLMFAVLGGLIIHGDIKLWFLI